MAFFEFLSSFYFFQLVLALMFFLSIVAFDMIKNSAVTNLVSNNTYNKLKYKTSKIFNTTALLEYNESNSLHKLENIIANTTPNIGFDLLGINQFFDSIYCSILLYMTFSAVICY
jgi:spore germination protein GerM